MFHKEGSVQAASSSSGKKASKAVDVPLRKSDRRALRDRAVAYFSRSESNDHDDDSYARQLQAACDDIFLKGNLASRTLPAPGNKATSMVLYLKTPSNNNNDATSYWPFETSSQFVWMALEEKKTI